MERDHKVRIMLGGLHGPAREARKMSILQYGVDPAFDEFHRARNEHRYRQATHREPTPSSVSVRLEPWSKPHAR